jgi:hypothetical protein
MPDTLHIIADNLVNSLASQFGTVNFSGTIANVAVEWTDNPTVDLSDAAITTPLVWVLDWGETLVAERGEEYEEYQILIIVQMKIPDVASQASVERVMAGLVHDIARYLRPWESSFGVGIDDTEAAECIRVERKAAKNLDEWHAHRRYFAEVLTVWRRY